MIIFSNITVITFEANNITQAKQIWLLNREWIFSIVRPWLMHITWVDIHARLAHDLLNKSPVFYISVTSSLKDIWAKIILSRYLGHRYTLYKFYQVNLY